MIEHASAIGAAEAKKRLLLVMNPCAGMRRANRYLANIASLFMKHGYESLVCMTEKRGDATRFVCRHIDEVELVVAVGGDGTFNEVVTGLLETGRNTPIGYIPAGSTNDFAASLKLSRNILRAAEDCMVGTPCPLDIGRFGERYFSYTVSFGAFTKASYATPQNVKNAMGHLAYILQGIRDLGSLRAHRVRLETAEAVFEDEYLFGAVSNSTSLGGILTLDPRVVDMNDGHFEVLLIRSPQTPGDLNECIRSLTFQDYRSPMLTFCSTPWARITASPDMDWTLDGEYEAGHETVEVQNLNSAIRLMMNKTD